MKCVALTLLALTATLSAVDSDYYLMDDAPQQVEKPEVSKGAFSYSQLGATSVNHKQGLRPIPSIVYGKRYESKSSAIDVSYSLAGGEVDSNELALSYVMPRIMFLTYFTPKLSWSPYLGIGLSAGGYYEEKYHTTFHGLFGNASLGFEFNRHGDFRNMFEVKVHQPALGIKQSPHSYYPLFEAYFGIGF